MFLLFSPFLLFSHCYYYFLIIIIIIILLLSIIIQSLQREFLNISSVDYIFMVFLRFQCNSERQKNLLPVCYEFAISPILIFFQAEKWSHYITTNPSVRLQLCSSGGFKRLTVNCSENLFICSRNLTRLNTFYH